MAAVRLRRAWPGVAVTMLLVLFAEDYSVMRAAIIPYSVAVERATYVEHTNSHRFMLRDDV